MQELRDYQESAILDCRRALRSNKRIVLALPTGAGKTTIASEIALMARARGKRCLFIVHLKTLVVQATAHFAACGLHVGVIQGENTAYSQLDDVIVASIHTLRNRKLPDWVDLVFIDECHILYQAHKGLMQRWSNVPTIGLTATPLREDLGLYFQALVRGPTVRDLIDAGHLVPVRAFYPGAEHIETILSGCKVQASVYGGRDYNEKQLSQAMRPLIGDVVRTWQEKADNRKTVLFAVTKADSRAYCETFEKAGVAADYIEDKTPQAERKRIFDDLRSGRLSVLCSVGVVAIGFDMPEVSCLILARPTLSPALNMQQVGRGLRTAPGKDHCLILDHAGNLIRHGLPQEFVVPDLQAEERNGKREKQEPPDLTLLCKGCGQQMEKDATQCPACGMDRPKRKRHYEVIDGELVEHDADAEADNKPPIIRKRDDYLGLLWYAREHNYKDGWAFIKFKTLYPGEKPIYSWKHIEPKPPSVSLYQWIVRQQRAWYASTHGGFRK